MLGIFGQNASKNPNSEKRNFSKTIAKMTSNSWYPKSSYRKEAFKNTENPFNKYGRNNNTKVGLV